jgi:hypothetical protein
VIGIRQQRVEPKPALIGRRGGLLLRKRSDQGGIEIQDHPPVLDRCPNPIPHPRPGHRTGRADRLQCGIDILGKRGHQPQHRRIRGHQPEHCRLGVHYRDIRGAVCAPRDRHR